MSQSNLKPWKPGQSGNPKGRPKGSKQKLAEDFLSALHDDFKEHGQEAIKRLRAEDNSTYCRILAGIVPKDVSVEVVRSVADLTDAELAEYLSASSGEGVAKPEDGAAEHSPVH